VGERNLAEALVGRGIPAVLAMAERIPDDVALTLSRLFYRNLKQGYPIDLSLSRARQGLVSAYGSHQLYWALPILYLHSEFDGYLKEGDRTLDNPADRLMLIPQGYDVPQATAKSAPPLPADAVPDSRYLEPTDDWQVLNEAVLLDDDLTDLAEGGNPGYAPDYTEYEADLDDELDSDTVDYEEEQSIVANLLNQLSSQEGRNGSGSEAMLVTEAADPDLEYDEARANSAGQTAISRTQAKPDAESSQWVYDDVPVTQLSRATSVAHPLEADQAAEQPARSASVVAAIQPVFQPLPSRTKQLPRFVLPLVGAAGVGLIALISFLVVPKDWFNPEGNPDNLLPQGADISETLEAEVPDVDEADLDTAETTTVTAIAIEHFNQGQISEGERAVRALLDRNALPQAVAALATVPPAELDQPEVSFLRGRLAWQAIQAGDENFGIDDVRRYWGTAVREQPDNPNYRIALGFAHYAENQFNEAIQEWVAALSELEDQQAANLKAQTEGSANADVPLPEQLVQGEDALNAYAGIALALKAAADQPSADQDNLESKAFKLHQMVMMSDPTSFQADALSQNWLWTEEAIQAWNALSQREEQ
ncbi:MAG: CHAT domain-containing protein, partial [Leptolyngbyaceae cyanobacterium SL_5_14]|nr:CHAT domain-containing protein [Leptolyngbyaceae cyanobacterium SL_5_14]